MRIGVGFAELREQIDRVDVELVFVVIQQRLRISSGALHGFEQFGGDFSLILLRDFECFGGYFEGDFFEGGN